jgi:hypothetical protein
MGDDHEFNIKVDDPRFVPTIGQLEQIVRLLDIHGLSANDYPSAEENENILLEMRNQRIINDISSLKEELKNMHVRTAIIKYFIGKGWNKKKIENWIKIRNYEYGKEFHLRLISNKDLHDEINAKLAKNPLKCRLFESDIEIKHVPPFGSGHIFICESEPEIDSENTRFFIYSENYIDHAGDRGLHRFRAFFKIWFEAFLKETSLICGRNIELYVRYT